MDGTLNFGPIFQPRSGDSPLVEIGSSGGSTIVSHRLRTIERRTTQNVRHTWALLGTLTQKVLAPMPAPTKHRHEN
jgi:hypothetical protein